MNSILEKITNSKHKAVCCRWSPNPTHAPFSLMLLIALTALSFIGCGQAVETGKLQASTDAPSMRTLPETEPSQSIEDMAVHAFAIEASLGENHYQYVKVDLDDDSAPETLVWLYGANFTSAKGDALMILRPDGTLLQSFHGIHTPITISKDKKGLYRSFYMYSENGNYARFDAGLQYPEVKDMAVEVGYEDVEGQEIFNDLEEDSAHPFDFVSETDE